MRVNQEFASNWPCALRSNGLALPARISVRTPVASGITFCATLATTRANIPSAVAPRYRARYGNKPVRFFHEDDLGAFLAVALAPTVAAAALIEAPTWPYPALPFPEGNVGRSCPATGIALSRDSTRYRWATHVDQRDL